MVTFISWDCVLDFNITLPAYNHNSWCFTYASEIAGILNAKSLLYNVSLNLAFGTDLDAAGIYNHQAGIAMFEQAPNTAGEEEDEEEEDCGGGCTVGKKGTEASRAHLAFWHRGESG